MWGDCVSFPLAARKYILRFVPSRNFESALMIAANKLSNFRSCPHCPILTLVRTISGHAGTGLSTECGGIKPRSDRIAQELAPLARFRVHWLPSMRACFLLFLELLCRARVGALSCFELNLSRRSCRRVSDRNNRPMVSRQGIAHSFRKSVVALPRSGSPRRRRNQAHRRAA